MLSEIVRYMAERMRRGYNMMVKKYTPWQYLGVAGTIACVVIFVRTPSFPTPDKLVVFLTFVFMIFGQALEMLKRVLPFAAILLVYESFRGIATHLNAHVNWLWMPGMDRTLAGGHLPTAVLQSWWWHGHVQWYDFVFYVPYMLHFVLPFTLALIIWKTRESWYWRYITTFLVVSFAGFLTFAAFPAAPPWMASNSGFIEPITRVSSQVWFALGVHDFPSVYNKITPNPVAAVPSLHAAYSTLIALYVIVLFKSRWRWLVVVYPMLIYVGTIYQGEHYMIDEILGALYGVGAFLVAPYVLRGLRAVKAKLLAVLRSKRVAVAKR
jgi:hypothetical protein